MTAAESGQAALRLPVDRGVPAVSLLLEALKKAELAKQNASGQQAESAAAPAESCGRPAEPRAHAGRPAERPLITRDRLPDITQPLEILSEDLPSAGIRREAPPAPRAERRADGRRGDCRRAAVPRKRSAPPRASSSRPKHRTTTRGVRSSSIVGLLGVAILGTLGYFACELFGPRPSYHAAPAGGTSVVAAAGDAAGAARCAQPSAAPERPGAAPAAAAAAPVATATAAGPAAVPATPQPAAPAELGRRYSPRRRRPGITQTRAEPSGTHSAAAEPAEPRASPTRAPVQHHHRRPARRSDRRERMA